MNKLKKLNLILIDPMQVTISLNFFSKKRFKIVIVSKTTHTNNLADLPLGITDFSSILFLGIRLTLKGKLFNWSVISWYLIFIQDGLCSQKKLQLDKAVNFTPKDWNTVKLEMAVTFDLFISIISFFAVRLSVSVSIY